LQIIKYIVIGIFLIFSLSLPCHSQVFSFESNPDIGTAVLPAGTLFRVVAVQDIFSNRNKIGDIAQFVVLSDFLVGRDVCIPSDTLLTGRVVQIDQEKLGRDGFVQISVDTMIFPDGWSTPIKAKIFTGDGTGVIGGGPSRRKKAFMYHIIYKPTGREVAKIPEKECEINKPLFNFYGFNVNCVTGRIENKGIYQGSNFLYNNPGGSTVQNNVYFGKTDDYILVLEESPYFKKIPQYIEDMCPVSQQIETGSPDMGISRGIRSGTNLIIVLDKDLQVKYLRNSE
jgi:hypothetical protein